MKITIAPDSYKGSLSANDAAKTIERAIKSTLPDAQTFLKPMADGGEGTLDTLIKTLNGQKVFLKCKGPLGEEIETYYGIIEEDTAVIEIANICGLTLVPFDKRNPEKTTTYGIGETIEHAVNNGFKKIIIGLGGSATNDGGYGMLRALGVKGLDINNQSLSFFAKDLYALNQLDWRYLNPDLKDVTITVANDVSNPLCGQNGASFIYGEQKGGTIKQIEKLDQALLNFARIVEHFTHTAYDHNEGAGAAGGLGFALRVIGATLTPGAKLIGKRIKLDSSIISSDLVITGEGKSDKQTLHGKAPIYVSQLAKEYKKPIILISGSVENNHKELTKNFTSVFSILNAPLPIEEAMFHAEELLYNQVVQIMQLIKLNI
ncbi:MAG TPA: glycerate kinase [Pseudogracilibacillus sp.]|nr:glycerate kinase [Pseudogracilibacillus sp.]